MGDEPIADMREPSLSDWNWAVLMLQQAMLGAISANFRVVELAYEGGGWIVRVTLAEDDPSDREEIKEICDSMWVYLADIRDRIDACAYTDVRADVLVSHAPLILEPRSAPRVVFQRRE
ncbi:MAG: hypothetical protein R3E18_07845 [Sphingomonadaceae bacterium]|nr:hypothetical protein [Sphingomonadaceae bacterium]